MFLLSMNMPMMDIGPMSVRMGYRLMHMDMIMIPFAFNFIVLVEVMLIMLMGMAMSDPFMPVGVAMHFPIKEKHS